MKIWTIVTVDENGTRITIRYSEEEADLFAHSFVSTMWEDWARPEDGFCPFSWEDAYEQLQNRSGMGDLGEIYMEAHDISDHPAICAVFDQTRRMEALLNDADAGLNTKSGECIDNACDEIVRALVEGDKKRRSMLADAQERGRAKEPASAKATLDFPPLQPDNA